VCTGLDYFFGDDLGSAPLEVFDTYRNAVRNGLAHVSFTKKRIIVHHNLKESDYLFPLMWGTHRGVDHTLAINIPLWQTRIESRFFEFVSAIRYPRSIPTHEQWREQFLHRIEHISEVT
ncbi:MAG TPA: hypothetical protein VER79_10390, partial [Candidatus Limnocylindrales bacterium]|nr:hypothetical protein [Candidatus Limnocylindrales bacterium]